MTVGGSSYIRYLEKETFEKKNGMIMKPENRINFQDKFLWHHIGVQNKCFSFFSKSIENDHSAYSNEQRQQGRGEQNTAQLKTGGDDSVLQNSLQVKQEIRQCT